MQMASSRLTDYGVWSELISSPSLSFVMRDTPLGGQWLALPKVRTSSWERLGGGAAGLELYRWPVGGFIGSPPRIRLRSSGTWRGEPKKSWRNCSKDGTNRLMR